MTIRANKLLHYALATKEQGVFYPADAFNFEEAMVISINDASHAASFDFGKDGTKLGHRSQSGRLLALASKEFVTPGKGHLHVLQWSSTVIKRVCRSTLQAETLSLQLGSEDAEHVRRILHQVMNLKEEHGKREENQIDVMDKIPVLWLTDCRSLSDHLHQPGGGEVSDKRLAIDLTSLRQDAWREIGELIGNPTYSDVLPENATTKCKWVSTATMAADGLTKLMKCEQLLQLMNAGYLQVDYQHISGQQNKDGSESDL